MRQRHLESIDRALLIYVFTTEQRLNINSKKPFTLSIVIFTYVLYHILQFHRNFMTRKRAMLENLYFLHNMLIEAFAKFKLTPKCYIKTRRMFGAVAVKYSTQTKYDDVRHILQVVSTKTTTHQTFPLTYSNTNCNCVPLRMPFTCGYGWFHRSSPATF